MEPFGDSAAKGTTVLTVFMVAGNHSGNDRAI
jgi:hypothetical protein